MSYEPTSSVFTAGHAWMSVLFLSVGAVLLVACRPHGGIDLGKIEVPPNSGASNSGAFFDPAGSDAQLAAGLSRSLTSSDQIYRSAAMSYELILPRETEQIAASSQSGQEEAFRTSDTSVHVLRVALTLGESYEDFINAELARNRETDPTAAIVIGQAVKVDGLHGFTVQMRGEGYTLFRIFLADDGRLWDLRAMSGTNSDKGRVILFTFRRVRS